MTHTKKGSRFTAATDKSAITVTCVTDSTYNIAQDKEKIKYFINKIR